jgi:hypothetical protein
MAKAIAGVMGQPTAKVMAASAEAPVRETVNEGLDRRWRFQVLR